MTAALLGRLGSNDFPVTRDNAITVIMSHTNIFDASRPNLFATSITTVMNRLDIPTAGIRTCHAQGCPSFYTTHLPKQASCTRNSKTILAHGRFKCCAEYRETKSPCGIPTFV